MEQGIIADLHIHSRFSRGTSKDIDFENLAKFAKIKGVNLLGTGDFTHPSWLNEIKKLHDSGAGIYYYKGFPFLLSCEISLIYSDGKKQRRVHLLVLAPNIEIVEQINDYLDTLGRRDYDGRPTFGLGCAEFVESLHAISRDIEIIPAHCMTPWYGIFGSKSGFDSLEEAFGDKTKEIHAIESGMSADPEMLWRLDTGKAIVSFSDAHSFWPWRIGREATIFKQEKELSYKQIISQIRHNTFLATVEVDPAYGKYHYDGHRNCNFSASPEETKKLGGICPVCGRPLTIGVENRVEQLAKKPRGFRPKNAKQFYKLLPLHELIALVYSASVSSQKVWTMYNRLITFAGSEFGVLLQTSKQELAKANVPEKLIELIMKNREGKIKVKPGYDGEYGKPILSEQQKTLF